MSRLSVVLLILAFLLFLRALPVAAEPARVTRVVDGDTLVLAGVGTVRLQGIDVPEWQAGERDAYFVRQGVAPARLRQISVAARRHLLALVGEAVQIEGEEVDRYGRRVVQLWRPDGTLLNQQLLEKGYAVVYRRFDFAGKEAFLAAEKSARQNHVGLWAPADKSTAGER